MAPLRLTVDDDLHAAIQQYAADHGITMADAVRVMLRSALDSEDAGLIWHFLQDRRLQARAERP